MPVSLFSFTGGDKEASVVNNVAQPTAHKLALEIAGLVANQKTSPTDWNAIKAKLNELVTLCNANESAIGAGGAGYTDEQAQDAIGSILTDSATINFTYDDSSNTITAVVITSGINHDELQNVGTTSHTDIDAHISDDTIHLSESDINSINRTVSALQATADTAARAGAVSDIRNGVDSAGDDLAKLYALIAAINALLTSDETTLDELQEIVDYIELNREDLENLSVPSIAGLQAALDAKDTALSAHTTDTDIHLDQSDVESIGDARYSVLAHNHDDDYADISHEHDTRYERAELSFSVLTLSSTVTITVTSGVLRFLRTLNINAATNPTIAISGSPVSGLMTVTNSSGGERTVTLPSGHHGGDGDSSPVTIQDGEKYEFSYINDGIHSIWMWRKIGTAFA